jgi:hypothetical protein
MRVTLQHRMHNQFDNANATSKKRDELTRHLHLQSTLPCRQYVLSAQIGDYAFCLCTLSAVSPEIPGNIAKVVINKMILRRIEIEGRRYATSL